MKRRYLILAPGEFLENAKTAHGVIRYGTDDVVAVIDPDHTGKTVADVLPHLQSDAPFVRDVASGLATKQKQAPRFSSPRRDDAGFLLQPSVTALTRAPTCDSHPRRA